MVDNGAENIRYRLLQVAADQDWAAHGWSVSSRATIHTIPRQEGLVTPQPKKRPKSSYRRFTYARAARHPQPVADRGGRGPSDLVRH